MKKIFSLCLVLLLLFSLSATAFAAPNQSRAVIGADLTDEQIEQVYSAFGVARGSVVELRLTIQEERAVLGGYVDDSIIGSKSISSVYVELLPEGSGMDVSTSNVTWCSPEMYMNALATGGITDAKVIVAAPYQVSGTAALAGIFKAYEDMTGKKLDDMAKLVSTQELTITGDLASQIGSMDSAAIVNDLKLMLDETRLMSDSQLLDTITNIAGEYNVNLSDLQSGQLIDLCRSLENLDSEALRSRVEEVQNTLQKLSTAKTKVEGFVGKVSVIIESITSFLQRIGKFLGL